MQKTVIQIGQLNKTDCILERKSGLLWTVAQVIGFVLRPAGEAMAVMAKRVRVPYQELMKRLTYVELSRKFS